MPSIYGTSNDCKGGGVEASLPATAILNERLISTGSEFVVDGGQALLGSSTLSDTLKTSVVIGDQIATTANRSILLNTGSSTTNTLDSNILLQTDAVSLSIDTTGNTDPLLLGSLNDSSYTPITFEDIKPATNWGEYLYYNSTTSKWESEFNDIYLGKDAGKQGTKLRSNVFVGSGAGNSATATYDLSTIVGTNCGRGCLGDSNIVIGTNTGNDQVNFNSVVVGSLNNNIGASVVAVGYRLGYNPTGSDFLVNSGSVALGSQILTAIPFGTFAVNATNISYNTAIPQGSITLLADKSKIKLDNVNIDATQQGAGRWGLVSTDGSTYSPASIANVYKNQRVFFTHYTKTGDPVLTANIGITSAFNLFTAPTRRLEYNTFWDWTLTATNRMKWKGSNNTPVSVEVNMEVERVSAGLCIAQLVPVLNGSETDARIAGNACIARLSRNSSTSLHLSLVLDLDTNDELSFLLKRINGTATSNVRIRYSDVKIYSLRTDKLAEMITTDP